MPDFTRPVLALDSALGGCIAAVFDPVSGKAWQRVLETEREQAAKLIPIVQETMKEAGMAFADLGLIVTTKGPGSFTGLRISLSSARSLGLALSLPVQGVDGFTAMAASCAEAIGGGGREVMVVLESKRADFYVGLLDKEMKPTVEYFCAQAKEIVAIAQDKDMVLCGDATQRLLAEAGENPFAEIVPRMLFDPTQLARVGHAHFKAANGQIERPEPLYLRGADVSVSNKTQRFIKDLPL